MIVSYLQKLGILPKIFRREVDDAQVEDVLRTSIENAKATNGATIAAVRSHNSNDKLRESIRRVRSSSAFADFERSVRGINDR